MRLKISLRAIIVLVIAAVLSLGSAPQAMAATIDLNWTTRADPGGTDVEWNDVAWSSGLGKFVAVAQTTGFNDRTMSSTDGITWTGHPAAEQNTWTGIAWSPELNIFAAVAADGANPVMTSSDGDTWTPRSAPAGEWSDVIWAAELGKFVAIGSQNLTMTSSDGITWQSDPAAENNVWRSVAWSPELNKFVAVAWNGSYQIMTSSDGESWTGHVAPESNSWESVTWSSERSLFVAVSSDGTNRVLTSPDGENWTPHPAPVVNSWRDVVWVPEIGLFIVVGAQGPHGSMASSDAINWTPYEVVGAIIWFSVAFSPELGVLSIVGTNPGTTTARVASGVPVPTLPTAPFDLQAAAVNSSQIHLSWGAATSDNPYSPVIGYKIERKFADGSFTTLVENTGSVGTTYEDVGLQAGTEYTYRISAMTSAGAGPVSNIATAITPATSASSSGSGRTLAPTGMSTFDYVSVGVFLVVAGSIVFCCRKYYWRIL